MIKLIVRTNRYFFGSDLLISKNTGTGNGSLCLLHANFLILTSYRQRKRWEKNEILFSHLFV